MAMFNDPKVGGDSPVDAGTYLGKVVRLEDGGDFGNGPTIKWIWNLWTEHDKEPVTDDDGNVYEFHALSSTKLTKGSRGMAKARQWAEVLLGHDIEGMSGEDVADAVVGKGARVTVVMANGYPRIPEEGLSPIKAAAKKKVAAAVAAPAPDEEDEENSEEDSPF